MQQKCFTRDSNPRPSDNKSTAMADDPEGHRLMNSGGNFNYTKQEKRCRFLSLIIY